MPDTQYGTLLASVVIIIINDITVVMQNESVMEVIFHKIILIIECSNT